jgi:hypothetical protein
MKSAKKIKLGALKDYQAFVEPVAGSFGGLVDEYARAQPEPEADVLRLLGLGR